MKNKFISLRVKILIILVVFSTLILLLAGTFVPYFTRNYLLELRKQRLLEQQTVVSSLLDDINQAKNPDSRIDLLKSEESFRFMDLSARSSEMCIWICIPVGDSSCATFQILQFGKTDSMGENYDQSSITISLSELEIIQNAYSGNNPSFYQSAFPSCFSENTLSLSFIKNLQNPIEFKDLTEDESILVFIHSPLNDLYSLTDNLMWVLFVIILLLYLLIWGLVFYLTAHVIDPVKKMQSVADSIKRGDFSQSVSIRQNDEIGQLAESINSMSSELSEIDTIQSDFITNISHDFRSPLTSIKGYVEAILDGTIDKDSQSKYLNIVLDETNRLTKMANNVLDLSKLQSGQIEIHPVPFNLNEMIIRLALGFEKRVDDRQIEMNLDFVQEKLICVADENLIERVVYNLLDNALKFTPQKGKITIETSIVSKKAFISVKDNGIGISEDSLPHIFERFHKGDKSRGRDRQGAGLGLTIVKQILNAHNENISVSSTVGKGTAFSFSLPLE